MVGEQAVGVRILGAAILAFDTQAEVLLVG